MFSSKSYIADRFPVLRPCRGRLTSTEISGFFLGSAILQNHLLYPLLHWMSLHCLLYSREENGITIVPLALADFTAGSAVTSTTTCQNWAWFSSLEANSMLMIRTSRLPDGMLRSIGKSMDADLSLQSGLRAGDVLIILGLRLEKPQVLPHISDSDVRS